jgi:hypothetical protein
MVDFSSSIVSPFASSFGRMEKADPDDVVKELGSTGTFVIGLPRSGGDGPVAAGLA